jgi:hypothetical protein
MVRDAGAGQARTMWVKRRRIGRSRSPCLNIAIVVSLVSVTFFGERYGGVAVLARAEEGFLRLFPFH